ncbi:MAG: ATPase [Moraxellaceae bacterium]|nr:ATPase [Moraxellaceae bacterium]
MSQTPDNTTADSANDQAAAAGGGYEILKRRLETQGVALAEKAKRLNEARIAEFGRSELKLQGRLAARTENNCVARDIVRVGSLLVFGYNVFIGLRKETAVADVFSLYTLSEANGSHDLVPQPLEGSFLADPRFTADFRELYAYYKNASLTQLRVHQHKLLAAFRIGAQVTDVRVFRWEIREDGTLQYIDNRGERDIALPPAYDFEWALTTREHHVNGRHPHINILDTIFVETVNGDLTIKVENNTETGLGIYSEPVQDRNQSLADADIAFAKLGTLILLRVRPYREETTRYLVFNARTQQVVRIDAIGKSCVQLPEDHGIIFPGGYLLQSGEFKRFDLPPEQTEGLRFKRMLRSPNGEDVLYVFYEPGRGGYGLFTYNLIEKTLGTPLMASGYARFDDGRVLVFQSEGDEPLRSHAMQVWQTPFTSDDHARQSAKQNTFFGRIGNPELVRGVSELLAISRAVREQAPTRVAYDDLVRQCTRVLDAHFWLDEADAGNIAADVRVVAETARNTLDEFDKVAALRREASRQLQQAQAAQHQLLTDIAATLWQHPNDFVTALSRLQTQRGQLHALKDVRYIDVAQIEAMDAALEEEETRIGEKTVAFRRDGQGLGPADRPALQPAGRRCRGALAHPR